MRYLKTTNTLAAVAGCVLIASMAMAAEPMGCYALDGGSVAVALNVPGIIKLNATTQAVALLGIKSSFSEDGQFMFSIPALSGLNLGLPTDFNGTWAMAKGSAYVVNLTDFDAMAEQFKEQGLDGRLTQAYKGSVLNDGEKIKGTFNIGLNVNAEGMAISAKISGKFTGTRASLEPCPPTSEASDGGLDFSGLLGRQ